MQNAPDLIRCCVAFYAVRALGYALHVAGYVSEARNYAIQRWGIWAATPLVVPVKTNPQHRAKLRDGNVRPRDREWYSAGDCSGFRALKHLIYAGRVVLGSFPVILTQLFAFGGPSLRIVCALFLFTLIATFIGCGQSLFPVLAVVIALVFALFFCEDHISEPAVNLDSNVPRFCTSNNFCIQHFQWTGGLTLADLQSGKRPGDIA